MCTGRGHCNSASTPLPHRGGIDWRFLTTPTNVKYKSRVNAHKKRRCLSTGDEASTSEQFSFTKHCESVVQCIMVRESGNYVIPSSPNDNNQTPSLQISAVFELFPSDIARKLYLQAYYELCKNWRHEGVSVHTNTRYRPDSVEGSLNELCEVEKLKN